MDINRARNSVPTFMHYAICIMHYFLIALFSTAVAYADSIPTRLCRPTAYKSPRVQELKSSRSKFLPLKGDGGSVNSKIANDL